MTKQSVFCTEEMPPEERHEEMLFQRKQPLLSNVNFVPSMLRKQIKSLVTLVKAEEGVVAPSDSEKLDVPEKPKWRSDNIIFEYLGEREKWLNSWKMAVTRSNSFKSLSELLEELIDWELDYQRGISTFFENSIGDVEPANSRDALDYQRWRELLPAEIWNGSWEELTKPPNTLDESVQHRILAEAGRCSKLHEIYNRER